MVILLNERIKESVKFFHEHCSFPALDWSFRWFVTKLLDILLSRNRNWNGRCSLSPAARPASFRNHREVKTSCRATSSRTTRNSRINCSASKSTKFNWKKRYLLLRLVISKERDLIKCFCFIFRLKNRRQRKSECSRIGSTKSTRPLSGSWKWERHLLTTCSLPSCTISSISQLR